MAKTIDGFCLAYDFLVCIDSDGCAFESSIPGAASGYFGAEKDIGMEPGMQS